MRRRDFIRGLVAMGVALPMADHLAFVNGLGRMYPSAGWTNRATGMRFTLQAYDSDRRLTLTAPLDAPFRIGDVVEAVGLEASQLWRVVSVQVA